MKTSEAVAEVLRAKSLSKYALAKALGMRGAISVNQWLRGTRMSAAVAEKFTSLYGIEIDDSFSQSSGIS